MKIQEAREILKGGENSAWPYVYAQEWEAKGFVEAWDSRTAQVRELVKAMELAIGKLDFEAKDAMMRGDTAWIAEVQPITQGLQKALAAFQETEKQK